MHLSPSRTGPLDRSRNDLGLSPCVAFVLACCSPPGPPMPHNSELVCGVDRLECGLLCLFIAGSHPFMLILGWPRASPGCRSLAAWALWILVVRFLPSTGRSPVGTLEQHRDSAGPGRQLTTVSALGWPLARPWGGSRFRRCRRRWPSTGPGSACGRGGCWDSTGKRRAFTLRLCWF